MGGSRAVSESLIAASHFLILRIASSVAVAVVSTSVPSDYNACWEAFAVAYSRRLG